jgi:phage-related minor tail protein
MSIRLILVLLLALLFGTFVAVNWSVFLAPTSLSVLVTTVEAPLGLLMLGVLAAVTALFGGYMAWWQARVLLETRRHTQELQAQRALADQAEASRFTALQGVLQAEVAKLVERVDTSGEKTRQALQDSGNSLAAYIGEVEDKLDRVLEPGRNARP